MLTIKSQFKSNPFKHLSIFVLVVSVTFNAVPIYATEALLQKEENIQPAEHPQGKENKELANHQNNLVELINVLVDEGDNQNELNEEQGQSDPIVIGNGDDAIVVVEDAEADNVTTYASGNLDTYFDSTTGTFYKYYDEAYTTIEINGTTYNVGRLQQKIFPSGLEYRYTAYFGNTEVYQFRERWQDGDLEYTRENYASGAQRALVYPSGTVYTYYEGTPSNRGNRESLFVVSTGYTYYYINEDFDGNGVGRRSRTVAPSGNEYTYEYWNDTDNIRVRNKFDDQGNPVWTRHYFEDTGLREYSLYYSSGNEYYYENQDFEGRGYGRWTLKRFGSTGTELRFTEYWPGTNTVKTRERWVLDNQQYVLTYTRTYYDTGIRESDTFDSSGNVYHYFNNSDNRRYLTFYASSQNTYEHLDEASDSYQHLNQDFNNSHGRYVRKTSADGSYIIYDEYWEINGQQTDMVKQLSEYDAQGNLLRTRLFDQDGNEINPLINGAIQLFLDDVNNHEHSVVLKELLLDTYLVDVDSLDEESVKVIENIFIHKGDQDVGEFTKLKVLAGFLANALGADFTVLNDLFDIDLKDGVSRQDVNDIFNQINTMVSSQSADDFLYMIRKVNIFIGALNAITLRNTDRKNMLVGVFGIDVNNLSHQSIKDISDNFVFDQNGNRIQFMFHGLDLMIAFLDTTTFDDFQALYDVFRIGLATGMSVSEYHEMVELFDFLDQPTISDFIYSIHQYKSFLAEIESQPFNVQEEIKIILMQAFGVSTGNFPLLTRDDFRIIFNQFLFYDSGVAEGLVRANEPIKKIELVARFIAEIKSDQVEGYMYFYNKLIDDYGIDIRSVSVDEYQSLFSLLTNHVGVQFSQNAIPEGMELTVSNDQDGLFYTFDATTNPPNYYEIAYIEPDEGISSSVVYRPSIVATTYRAFKVVENLNGFIDQLRGVNHLGKDEDPASQSAVDQFSQNYNLVYDEY